MELVLKEKTELKMKSKRLINEPAKNEFKIRIAREKQEANFYNKVLYWYFYSLENSRYGKNWSWTCGEVRTYTRPEKEYVWRISNSSLQEISCNFVIDYFALFYL